MFTDDLVVDVSYDDQDFKLEIIEYEYEPEQPGSHTEERIPEHYGVVQAFVCNIDEEDVTEEFLDSILENCYDDYVEKIQEYEKEERMR